MWQKIKNQYHLARSLLANIYYGFPGRRLTVIGVTGTSGKTTTSLMIYSMLKAAGYKVSVLTTIKAIIAGKEYDTGFHVTTPDPHILPKYLKEALDHGDTHVVLEVSSHALDQNRAAFIPFSYGVLTSFAHEHLDYHKTLENYAIAKFKLLHSAKTAILPIDVLDKNLKKVVKYDHLRNMKFFGLEKGDITKKDWRLSLQMPGDYNLLNALAAVSVGSLMGIDKKTIVSSLEAFSGIPGRFEEIPNKKGVRIIIDFAHKPDALESVLQVARTMVKGTEKIIVVYGCASERDTLKRPIMGKISGMLADVSVLTDEDPRRENPMKIINEIAHGCEEAGAEECQISNLKFQISNERKHIYFKIPDRAQAIDFAINTISKKGDVLLFCGKGHEQSMNYNGVERPWSEHDAVQKALNKEF